MNFLVLNLLVITLLPVLNLCGGGKISLQNSLSKQFVSGRSADTFFLYLFNKLRAYACEALLRMPISHVLLRGETKEFFNKYLITKILIMRKFTFKSLLIAAALCLSTSAWAQTTYYSQDYEAADATADWTTGTGGRFTPVLMTENENTYLSVDQATRYNNGCTLTSSSIGVSAGTDFTMTFDLKVSSSNNQTPVEFNIFDESGSSVIFSLKATGTSVTTWIVNGDNDNIVTLENSNKSAASNTITEVTWYSYIITRSGDMTYLTIKKTSTGDVVYERNLISTLSTTGGIGKMNFVTKRYYANFAIDNVVVRSIEDGDLPTLQETTYTINYKLGDDVVKTVTEASLETVTITADKVITENGVKYLIVSEEAPSITLDADASKNVLNVPVRLPYTATLSVTTKIGDETSDPVVTTLTETDDKVCSWSYTYSMYVEKDGGYYVADDVTSFVKTGTFTNGAEISKTIVYTLDDDVKYFGEWEDEAGKTGGSFNIITNDNFSNGKGKSLQHQDYHTMSVTFSVAEDGIYSITMPYYNPNNRERGHSIQLDGTELENKYIASYTGGTFTTEQFLAEGEHTIGVQLLYSLTSAFDYLLVKKIADATVTTTITAAGYATFSSTYAVDFSESGLAAYTAKVNDGNQTITLTRIADGIVPANTGVVLKGAAGEYTGAITTTDATVENDLFANSAEVTGDGTIYVLNKVGDNVGFYPLATGATLAAGKAYLQLNSAAKGYTFVWNDGETTGIEENYEFGTMNSDAATFDLSGRKVANPAKGLYIKNGKKFIVK